MADKRVTFTDDVLDISSDFATTYELDKCVQWIKDNNYSKVCLQFPDTLLPDSVEVALHIDENTSNKTYILGDTSYASCCVDEVASKHVNADAIIHFGHACLSGTINIPVLYVLPKKGFNIQQFIIRYEQLRPKGYILLLYDVGISYLISKLSESMADELKEFLVISELNTGSPHRVPCSLHCNILKGEAKHLSCRFARGYCKPNDKNFETVIYAGTDKCMTNFLMMLKNQEFYQYTGSDGFLLMNSFNLMKQSSYLIEKVKAAQTVAILVCTLSIDQFLIAVEHVKALCKRRNKKIYVISVGKPTPTKLANFPEVDLFVSIACPEAEFYERKTFVKPVVGLLDVELALNENRSWENTFSKDFRDLIEGGVDYIATPKEPPGDNAEVTLVEDRVLGYSNSISSTSLFSNSVLDLTQSVDVITDRSLTNKTSGKERHWDGLDPNLPAPEPTKPTDGRVGTSQGYLDEKELLNNKTSDIKEVLKKKSDEKETEDKKQKT